MLALVLERATMLGLDVHVNSALILLGELTVGALKLTILGANILECHFGGPFFAIPKNSIFWEWQK